MQQFPQLLTATRALVDVLAVSAFADKPVHPSQKERLIVDATAKFNAVRNLLAAFDKDYAPAPAPFQKPVFAEPGRDQTYVIKAADCELICMMDGATPDECAYIVKAINAYSEPAVPQLAIRTVAFPIVEALIEAYHEALTEHIYSPDDLRDSTIKASYEEDCAHIDNARAELMTFRPKVAVRIEGGCLQSASASTPMDFELQDDDNLEAEGKSEEEQDAAWESLTEGMAPIY